ncbi:MAG: DNA-directed RNA polymerase subunit H, partial [Candidatus Hydrothermarchaeales archaeon]
GEHLEFKILDHVLVPEHEILSDKEAEKLLEKHNISKGQLPKILITDPVIKKLKAKVGDVVKITRKSQTAGKTVVYKVVVKE